MSYRTLSLTDFRGGLNTSIDESLLSPSETASLTNVDILDSGAISRRQGYRDVLSLPKSPVKGIFRYYHGIDATSWVIAAGDRVYMRQDSVADVPLTVSEAEDTSVLPYGTPSVSGPAWVTATVPETRIVSGGMVARTTASTTFVIPYSTRITMRGALKESQLSIDGGSAVIATGHTHVYSALAATGHTITVVPPVRNDNVLRMRPQGDRKKRWVDRPLPILPTQVGEEVNLRVSIEFFDRYPDYQDDRLFQLRIIDAGNSDHVADTYPSGVFRRNPYFFYMGPVPHTEDKRYYYTRHDGNSRARHSTRSKGWHTFSVGLRITKDTVANAGRVLIHFARIDGDPGLIRRSQEYNVADLSNLRVRLFAQALTSGSSGRGIWANTFRINDALYDDFYDRTAWTSGGDTTTVPDAVVDETGQEWAANKSTYTDVDVFTYQASGDLVEVSNISASADHVGMAKMHNRAYLTTAHNDIAYTMGATAVAPTASGTTKGAHLVEFKRRFFAAGISTDRSLLNYTEVDAPDNWAGGGAIRLAGRDSGGECTGLAVFDDLLFFFAPSRVYALDTTGTADQWRAKTLHSRYGCVAPKSLVTSANGLIFLSDDGVRSYAYLKNIFSQDGSGIMLLSDNIRPTIESITNKSIAAGAIYKGRYWLSCALDGATSNNTILVCDTEKVREDGQPAWMRYDIPGITCMTTTVGDEYGLFAGTESGELIQLDIGQTDNGNSFKMSYTIPPLPVSGYETVKHFKHLHITAFSDSSQGMTFTPETDDVHGQTISVLLTPENEVRPIRAPLSARGRFIKANIESWGGNQPFTISSVAFTYRPSPRMR